MSRKKKSQDSDDKVKSEIVSYPEFFQTCLAKKMVKPWQEREIHAFFKDLGLSDKESADVYKIALAKY